MKTFFNYAALCCMLLAWSPFIHAQQNSSKELQIVFRFVKGNDMFYIPWSNNGMKLDSLCLMLEPARLEMGSIRVDGYGNDKNTVRTRCNRVKSELILRRRLREEHFTTTNRIGTFEGMHNVVVVTLPIIVTDTSKAQTNQPELTQQTQPSPQEQHTQSASEQEARITTEVQSQTETSEAAEQAVTTSKPTFHRWTAGLNVGIPFFWGDMLSMSADKSYIGYAVGVQGGYRFSELLAVSLSVDYARGKLGARGYAEDYLLAPDGVTWYVPQQQVMQRYGDLYSKVSLVNVGLNLDVNINQIFSKQAANHRFTVWVSPTVYGQFFSADIYTKADNKRYSDGTTKPDGMSLGLGGALTSRYRVTRCIDLQLKNTLLWITDNHFDGIRTPFGKTKQNALWLPQIGIVWNIK